MTNYRIYMEDCGPECQRWVMEWWQYQPHTLYFGNGSWMGKLEESMILEMVIDEFGNGINMGEMLTKFGKEFCKKYKQDAVFITKHHVTGETICA